MLLFRAVLLQKKWKRVLKVSKISTFVTEVRKVKL